MFTPLGVENAIIKNNTSKLVENNDKEDSDNLEDNTGQKTR